MPPTPEEEWRSVSSSQDDSSQDVDMSKHLETGFKRGEPSFADENPFAALDAGECDFDVVHPQQKSGKIAGIVMIPHLAPSTIGNATSPVPSKKRSTGTATPAQEEELALEEALLLSEEEARLLIQPDQVAESSRHCRAATALLQESKNMDQIVQSICTVPLAWIETFFTDLVAGGAQTLELANIHLWNRVLAADAMEDDDNIRTFHQRIMDLELPIGKTRGQYTTFLEGVFDSLPNELQRDWDLLRWLSMFELLALSACPAIFEQHAWIKYLVSEVDDSLPHTQVHLLSDRTLLQLLRSVFGKKLLDAANKVAPGSELLIGLDTLRASNFSVENLPTLSTALLTSPPAHTAGVETCH